MRLHDLTGEPRYSSDQHDAQAQQVEVGATVHGPFDELESVYLPFHRSIAPGLFESSQQCGFIPAKAFRKIGE